MRLPDPAAEDWSFPRASAGIALLVRYAVAHGVPARTALAGTGLDVAVLGPAESEVTAAQELRVVRTLRRELGEVGAAVGATYSTTSFGAFGLAMLAGPTVLDAMTTALRFIDLSHAFAIPRADVDGDRVVVTLDGERLARDVRRFLLERDATAVRQVLDDLVPGGVGAVLAVEAQRARVVFGTAELHRPLPRRRADRLALAEAVCRDVVDRRRARSGLAADVRVLMTQRLRDGAPMPEVAGALGWTERTLRRRLRDEGVGYRELLDEVRASLAHELSRGRSMPVAELAAHLGYSDAAAYLHARARWRTTVGRPALR